VLLLALSFQALGQNTLSITGYTFVSETRYSRNWSYVTYSAVLNNAGTARSAVTANLTINPAVSASVQSVPGQTNLHFSPVPANSKVPSNDTFTFFLDRSVPFDMSTALVWTFTAPVANAGPYQTVPVGTTVTLNGSGSSNPSGIGSLDYSWTFISRPPGTSVVLQGADSVMPTFVVNGPGDYVLALTVTNGAGTDTAMVTVSTSNSPPVANAGPNQTVPLGSTVHLNGGNSSDVDGDPLTFSWMLILVPQGSTATLTGATTVSPTFVADKAGTYVAQLVVNDGKVNSAPATVQITTQNTAPVANAGANQVVTLGATVQLNGSGSTDVDGDPLTFSWSVNTVPSGSTATLSNPTAVNPTFTADKPGTDVVQ
jgi:hypothetical protein